MDNLNQLPCDVSKKLSWIKKKTLIDYLNFVFVNKQTCGLNKYKQVIESKNLMELNNSPKYIKLHNFPKFLEWLKCKVKDVMSNLMQWFDFFF